MASKKRKSHDASKNENQSDAFRIRRSKRLKDKMVASSTQTEWASENSDAKPFNVGAARILTPHAKRTAPNRKSGKKGKQNQTPSQTGEKKKKPSSQGQQTPKQSSRSRASSQKESVQSKRSEASSKKRNETQAAEKVFKTSKFGEVPTRKLAQGRDAVVYVSLDNFEPQLVFKSFRSAKKATNEERFMRQAAAEGIAPQVYEILKTAGQATVCMQCVNAVPLPKFCKNRSSRVSDAMEQSMISIYDTLDRLKFTPNDSNPQNYLVDVENDKVWRIDFSASKMLKKGDPSVWDPANLTQILKDSFITIFPQFTLEVYRRAPIIPLSMRISSQHNEQTAKASLNRR